MAVARALEDALVRHTTFCRRRRSVAWVTTAAAVMVVVACARGDQVITETGDHTRVKVTGYATGNLHLLLDDGSIVPVPLARVMRMVIDTAGQMADFNEAERYLAEDQLQKAIVRYDRALRVATDFWPAVIQVRLLQACDRAGKFERAVQHFVTVAQDAPSAAAALIPNSIPQGRTPTAKRAAQRLTAEANRASQIDCRVLLELLRYAILSGTGDPAAARWTREVARTAIPPSIATGQVYGIQVMACRELLEAKAFDAVLASVEQAVADCPTEVLPDLLLLKGRALLARASDRDDLLASGAALMRVPIHFPDHQQAPEALFWAARVHERLERRDKAVQLLEECLAHARVSQALRQQAEAELSRLAS